MKGFFFESVGVPGGSPELDKGNSSWVLSIYINSTYEYQINEEAFHIK